jgi:hypothetical protein
LGDFVGVGDADDEGLGELVGESEMGDANVSSV